MACHSSRSGAPDNDRQQFGSHLASLRYTCTYLPLTVWFAPGGGGWCRRWEASCWPRTQPRTFCNLSHLRANPPTDWLIDSAKSEQCSLFVQQTFSHRSQRAKRQGRGNDWMSLSADRVPAKAEKGSILQYDLRFLYLNLKQGRHERGWHNGGFGEPDLVKYIIYFLITSCLDVKPF